MTEQSPQVQLTEAEAALTEFERAFIFSGTRCEFNRAARMLLPFVNGRAYEVVFPVCECHDIEVWYVNGSPRSWFYSVCHEHRMQPIGYAVRAGREHDTRRDEAKRKSGYTTERWHRARGA